MKTGEKKRHLTSDTLLGDVLKEMYDCCQKSNGRQAVFRCEAVPSLGGWTFAIVVQAPDFKARKGEFKI